MESAFPDSRRIDSYTPFCCKPWSAYLVVFIGIVLHGLAQSRVVLRLIVDAKHAFPLHVLICVSILVQGKDEICRMVWITIHKSPSMKTDIVLAIVLVGRDVEHEIGMVYDMIEPMENVELVLPCFADNLWRVEWVKTAFHVLNLPMHTTRILSMHSADERANALRVSRNQNLWWFFTGVYLSVCSVIKPQRIPYLSIRFAEQEL